ncbi:hypothetical protein FRC08_017182 [Ceratobasidium sp. 394]|nr:hypothetical protein FRC08_017182 [Ceratobasidium sp. 394]
MSSNIKPHKHAKTLSLPLGYFWLGTTTCRAISGNRGGNCIGGSHSRLQEINHKTNEIGGSAHGPDLRGIRDPQAGANLRPVHHLTLHFYTPPYFSVGPLLLSTDSARPHSGRYPSPPPLSLSLQTLLLQSLIVVYAPSEVAKMNEGSKIVDILRSRLTSSCTAYFFAAAIIPSDTPRRSIGSRASCSTRPLS